MNKCEQFLNFFDYLVEQSKISKDVIPTEVMEYYNVLKEQQISQKEKPILTEIGTQVLQ